jgi:hypothetical protein
MLHIKSIIPKVINKIKIKENLDDSTIREIAEKIIKKNTPNAEVFFYQNKSLYVRCLDSAAANELFLSQEKIKKKINKILSQTVVEKLIIKTK